VKKKGGRGSKSRGKDAPVVFRPLEAALRSKLKAKEKKLSAEAKAAPAPSPKKQPAPAEPSRDDLSPSDQELLRQFLAGTIPLDSKSNRIPRTASSLERRLVVPKQTEPLPDPDDEARERLRALVEGTSTFEVVDDGSHIEGRRADVDPRTLRRLRHGVMPIDARLDLHGMSLDQAKRAVEDFLASRRQSHERVVLIIHGKGEHSPRGMGVLRGEVGAWLSEGPASRHVACFATARNEDGGSGAVYVLLRR